MCKENWYIQSKNVRCQQLFVSELQTIGLHAVQKFCCFSLDVLSTCYIHKHICQRQETAKKFFMMSRIQGLMYVGDPIVIVRQKTESNIMCCFAYDSHFIHDFFERCPSGGLNHAWSTFFQDWPHFLGENPIWPQQFLVKNNSDFFQSFSFFRLCLSRISIIFQGFTLLKGFAAQRRQLLTKFL